MFVIKRGGKIEKFSFSKISNAVENAYESCGKKMPLKLISDIKAMFKNMDSDTGDIKIDVEEIRDIVEEKLVKDAPYDVSKSFIIERYKNAEENAIKERVRYMKNYQTNGQNAATSSATDPNANMNLKNVANMGAEVYKPDNRKTQRIMLYDSIKDLYSEKLAKQYLKDLTGHLIYSHDEASTPVLMNYCEAVSLYPILNGTASLDGTGTEAPKNLQSFCGQLINATFLLAGQCKGACLYKDQKLIVEINGIRQTIKAKDLVEKYLNNIKEFTNYQGTWEYSDVNDVKIFEDGVFVPLKKVYRRKYDNKIYKITSHTGKIAFTSKDHIFKAFRAGQACEVKAEELRKFETVFINREIPFDINSVDYKKGWIKGMLLGDGCLTQPDMVQLSVNYEQIYYGNIFNQYSKEIYNDELHQNKGHKCYQYETHKKDFSALLKEDINGSNAFDKNVDLTNKSIDYKIGLLDGILCSDGRYSNNLSIELVNKGVIDSIIYILQELGLNYKYRVMPSHDNKHEGNACHYRMLPNRRTTMINK